MRITHKQILSAITAATLSAAISCAWSQAPAAQAREPGSPQGPGLEMPLGARLLTLEQALTQPVPAGYERHKLAKGPVSNFIDIPVVKPQQGSVVWDRKGAGGVDEAGNPITLRRAQQKKIIGTIVDRMYEIREKAAEKGLAPKFKTEEELRAERLARIAEEKAKGIEQQPDRFIPPGTTPAQYYAKYGGHRPPSAKPVIVSRQLIGTIEGGKPGPAADRAKIPMLSGLRPHFSQADVMAASMPQVSVKGRRSAVPGKASGTSSGDPAIRGKAAAPAPKVHPDHVSSLSSRFGGLAASAAASLLGIFASEAHAEPPASASVQQKGRVLEQAPARNAERDAMLRQQANALGEKLNRQGRTVEKAINSPQEDGHGQNDLVPKDVKPGQELPKSVTDAIAKVPKRKVLAGSGKLDATMKDILDFFGSQWNRTDDKSARRAMLDMMSRAVETNPGLLEVIPDIKDRIEAFASENPVMGLSDDQMTYIFISVSLGESAIRTILQKASGHDDVTVVVRGIPPGVKLADAMIGLQKIAAEFNPIPSVIIDPALFREYDIDVVPAVVRTANSGALTFSGVRQFGDLLAKAYGLSDDSWLVEQINLGKKGNLGTWGDVYPITEPDLTEVLKKRIAETDWDAIKKKALERSYRALPQFAMEPAREDRVRTVDPTIEVAQDIKDVNGVVIRKAGERVNPLDVRPFHEALVVFNGKRSEEVEWVRHEATALKKRGLQVILVSTEVETANGWKGYEKLTDDLDSHVFMLTPEIISTWHLERTPSVVTAEPGQRVFTVREAAVQPRVSPMPLEEMEPAYAPPESSRLRARPETARSRTAVQSPAAAVRSAAPAGQSRPAVQPAPATRPRVAPQPKVRTVPTLPQSANHRAAASSTGTVSKAPVVNGGKPAGIPAPPLIEPSKEQSRSASILERSRAHAKAQGNNPSAGNRNSPIVGRRLDPSSEARLGVTQRRVPEAVQPFVPIGGEQAKPVSGKAKPVGPAVKENP